LNDPIADIDFDGDVDMDIGVGLDATVSKPNEHKTKKQKKQDVGLSEANPDGLATEEEEKEEEEEEKATTAIEERRDVTFKRLQLIKMSLAGAVLEPWKDVLSDTVERMSQIAAFASRFLNFYLTCTQQKQIPPSVSSGFAAAAAATSSHASISPFSVQFPPLSSIAFDKTFFEHIFKAVTCDVVVEFEPTIQFLRCVWIHALLLQSGVKKVKPLKEAMLWVEIEAMHVARTAIIEVKTAINALKEANTRHGKAVEKANNTGAELVSIPPDVTGSNMLAYIKSLAEHKAHKKQLTAPLSKEILTHASVRKLLPSCHQLDQCIKYASIAYRSSFLLYQSIGLKAHFIWYLLAKYKIKKKVARKWVEDHFLGSTSVDDDVDGEEAEEQKENTKKKKKTKKKTNKNGEASTSEAEGHADAMAFLEAEERENQAFAFDGEDQAEDDDGNDDSMVGAISWTADAQAGELVRLHSLFGEGGGKKKDWHVVVEFHHALLQSMEQLQTAARPLKQFALAPLTTFTRRFVLFDAKVLQDLCRHPIFKEQTAKAIATSAAAAAMEGNEDSPASTSAASPVQIDQTTVKIHRGAPTKKETRAARKAIKKAAARAKTAAAVTKKAAAAAKSAASGESPNFTKITSTSMIFDAHHIRPTHKALKEGRTLASTFKTDGIQLHLIWEKPVVLSCRVDAKIDKAKKAKQKEKEENPSLTASGAVDARTLKTIIPVLQNSDGPIFRKKTARLEDFTHGIFQSTSIHASRTDRVDPMQPFDIGSLPFKNIVAWDPGFINPLYSVVWDRSTRDWKKWHNLSKKEYYRELGQQHRRRRTEERLKDLDKESLGNRVAAHLLHLSLYSPKTSSPVECLNHLLYVNAHWNDMFSFYGSRRVARARFTSEQKRQSQVDRLIERLIPFKDREDSIIVLGSATFATSFKGSQSTPVARLIKEVAKVRRVVLVNEYFTTQMCSGCHLEGLFNLDLNLPPPLPPPPLPQPTTPASPAKKMEIVYPLRSNSTLRHKFYPPSKKTNHLFHPTTAMTSFVRTVEPKAMRLRREEKEKKRLLLPPPDPGEGVVHVTRNIDPLSRSIHGLKQCSHCGRYWHRDENAARNIGWVFIGEWLTGMRPLHLRRHSDPRPSAGDATATETHLSRELPITPSLPLPLPFPLLLFPPSTPSEVRQANTGPSVIKASHLAKRFTKKIEFCRTR